MDLKSFGDAQNSRAEREPLDCYPLKLGAKETLRGLLSEDSAADRFLISKYLRGSKDFNFDIVAVDSVADTIKNCKESHFDFLLLDLNLKDGGGEEVLDSLGREFPLLPTIILTGLNESSAAVSAMRRGAQDYLTKDNLNAEVLTRSVWTAIERHRVVEKLARANEQIGADDRTKTEFLANMSHEMRTPLSVILASCDTFGCGDQRLSPEALASIEMIRRNSQHLLSLVDGLLDTSRLELGLLSADIKKFSLEQELVPTLQSLALMASRKGITLKVNTAEGARGDFSTDPVRLAQILFNVVGNAIKFTDEGGVTVDISESLGRPRRLIFRVSDTGPGILPEHQKLLFKPFFQADSSPARRHAGAGLGLALTKRVAKALGGDIRLCDTSPERGAVFEIEILDDIQTVIKKATRSEPAAASRTSLAGSTIPRLLQGIAALVVEDCEDNQRLLKFFLEGAGATVTIATSGWEGVEKAAEHKFDLIVMDVQLPGLDGYGATRELRRRGYLGPVVALSAHAMETEAEKSLAAGCTSYISKPFEYRQLIEKLSALTSNRAN